MPYGVKQSDVTAILAAVDTEVAAIKAATDLLPDSGALSALATILAAVDTEIAAIKAITDLLPDAGALSALATILAAVDTEIAAIKAGLGYDGATAYVSGFNEFSLAGVQLAAHSTISVLFVIPEAVGSINAHNTAILTELQKLGHVDTITQADALTYPHFAEYNIIVCGTENGTPWTTSNLAHIKEFPEPVICVDAEVAAYLLIGTDGGNAVSKTALVAIDEIKANDLGIGITGVTGLATGSNTISSAATYSTINMSDADITETFFGTEATPDNTDVLLGVVFKRQPDGTRGILSDGSEAVASRYFYGPAYSAADLNTLGLAVLGLLGHMAIQVTTAALDFEISGDIGDLERKLFGNQATEFNNGNPMVEYLTGRNSSGTKLPIGKSIIDIIGAAYVAAGGGLGTNSVLSDLGRIHNLVDSAETAGPFSYLDAGGEQDVVEDTATTRRRISLEIDLDAMTQNGTIKIYRKVNGTNYRVWSTTPFVAAGVEQAFDAIFTTNQAWKLTYEEDADEGAARSIPYNVITEVIE